MERWEIRQIDLLLLLFYQGLVSLYGGGLRLNFKALSNQLDISSCTFYDYD